jgi:Concanavalin A-like lectin/glucanases superfamily
MSRGMLLRRSSGAGVLIGGTFLLACLVTALLVAQPGHAAGTEQGPIAAYSFDEGTGATVEDTTGHGHTATIEGAKWARGRYGGGLEFKGSEHDVVKIPASSELNFEEEFTLEAWVRPTSSTDKLAPVFGKTTGGGSGSKSLSYYLYAGNSESKPYGEVQHVLGTGKKATATTAPAGGTWTHLALTFDGAVERLYVNGAQVAETATEAPVTTTGELQIGAETEHSEYFSGRIDEVRIYNRALAAGEVGVDMETPIVTPKAGPVASYSFDEGTGTTVEDTTGHGHTATIEGAKWARGRYGDGLEFKGSEHNVVKVPASSELNFEEEFTLEAWVRPASSTDKLAPILGKTTGGGSGSKSLSYYLYAGNSESKPYGEVQHTFGTGKKATASTAPPGSTWTHLALTYDGAEERLYVNGVQVAETATEAPVTTTGELQIGAETEHAEYFSGRIDEVRIYNRALDGAEVGSDMEAPIQTPKQGPVAAWSFDEGTGTTVEDVTGDGHTGTIEGAEWTTGRYGGALNFESGTACVSVPDSPELRLSEEFTLEAWVRPVGGLFEDPIVVRESGGKPVFGLGIGDHVEGEVEGFIGQGKGSETVFGGDIGINEWTPVATTYDGGRIRVYEDGQLVAEQTAPTPPVTGEGPLKIGCDTPDGPFTGKIDEVRVYNRALDGAEVDADGETPLQTPKATPVAAYSFDEGTGTTVEDVTGDGHTATIEGARWTTHGRYGGGMEFEASKKDVLKIPASPELDFGEEFTLEAWVRPSGADNHSAPLIDKQEAGALGYFLYEGGSVSDRPYGAASEEQEFIHADEPLAANAWSHVAMTFTGNRTWLYVDGELVDNGAAEPTITSEGELEIGGSSDTSDWFDGRIDEVRIFNRGLDEAEVAGDMETPIQTPKQGPIAAWPLDEGEGTTAEDATGDGHEGTVEGAEWAPGKYGEALKFDGEGDVVKVPNSPEFALTEGFTLEAWVRPESASNEWAPILAKEIGGGKGAETLAWFLYEGGSVSNVPIGGNGPAPGAEELAIAEDPLPIDVWSHLALTYDGSQVRLYVDGELVDCSDVPADAPPMTEGELQIGAATEHGDHFVGRIDEPRVYNRPLSQGEVLASMGRLPYAQTAEAYGTNESEAVLAAIVNPQGQETTYRFQYGLTASYGQTAPEAPEVNEEPVSADEPIEVEEWIGGLEPGTTYHYRVIATNQAGTAIGQDQTVTTEGVAPKALLLGASKEKEEEKAKEKEKEEEEREAKSRSAYAGMIGINWNGDLSSQEALANRVAASGAKMFRVPIGAVTGGNTELFLLMAERGITILPNVVGVAGTKTGNRYPAINVEPTRGDWEGQLRGLLEKYGPEGEVWEKHTALAPYAPKFWEIWNEPNVGPSGAALEGKRTISQKAWADRYGELLEVAHSVFTTTDSQAKILLGGLLSVGTFNPNARPKQQPHITVGTFIKEVGHYGDYDGVAVHPYAFTGKDNTKSPTVSDVSRVAEKVMINIRKVRGALEDVKKKWVQAIEAGGGTPPAEPRKPIWVTEFGWPVAGHRAEEDEHHRLVTPTVQKDLLNASFNAMKGNAGLGKHELDLSNLLYYNTEDNTHVPAAKSKEELEKLSHRQREEYEVEREAIVKGAMNWANHCGLVETTGGVGGEEGKMREAWSAFVKQAE